MAASITRRGSANGDVLNIDRAPSPESSSPESPIPFLRVDVTDYGQVHEALSGVEFLPEIEAVVHLAAIPSPAHVPPDQVFRTNMTSTHAVFEAAARLGLRRVVWASSETTLGLPFERPPDYAPVDEAHILMAEVFPGVPVADRVEGNDTLLDISRARATLGYKAEFSWRELFRTKAP